MVVIKQQFVPEANRKSTFGRGNPKKKLVVHQTGNTGRGANAKMHALLQERGYAASWHIQSDDKEIIQSWPFDYMLYHASTGARADGGNKVGIGWEICINSDGDYLKSLEVASKGIAKVMKDEGIPISGLVTHNEEDRISRKWCPAQILSGKMGVNWPLFVQMVQNEMNILNKKPVVAGSKTYKVVNTVNGYLNANDAKNKKNAKTKVTAGNYTIFNEANGMINVTTKAGIPGSWINPSDNKAPAAKPVINPVAKPAPKPQGKVSYKEEGFFYTDPRPDNLIYVRDQPSLKGKIVAEYYIYGVNESLPVEYHTVHINEGYVWLQYHRKRNGVIIGQGYIPCREYKNGKPQEVWGKIK